MKLRQKIESALLSLVLLAGLFNGCGQTAGPVGMLEETQPAQSQSAEELEMESTSEVPPTTNVPSLEPTAEPTPVPSGEMTVRFLDVGQADAALIQCDGEYMLIDGGNREDSNLLYSVLQKEQIQHLKYVVGTHPHEDHIGGVPGALQYASADVVFSPTTQYDSKAFNNFAAAAEPSGGLVVPQVGDVYELGSALFTIVGVNADPEDANNSSILLRLVYGDTSFLFTGDAEREAEAAALESGYALNADVLKVGHHGSDTSTTYPFLREVNPRFAVISCGKNNSYGHPHGGVLSKLRDADVELYRTDLQGDILCTSDGTSLTWETQKVATEPTNPTAAPQSQPEPQREEPKEAVAEVQQPQQSVQEPAPAPAPADNGSYIGNLNTKKVHHSYCGSLPMEKNRIYFGSLEEALGQGYVKCKNCF